MLELVVSRINSGLNKVKVYGYDDNGELLGSAKVEDIYGLQQFADGIKAMSLNPVFFDFEQIGKLTFMEEYWLDKALEALNDSNPIMSYHEISQEIKAQTGMDFETWIQQGFQEL